MGRVLIAVVLAALLALGLAMPAFAGAGGVPNENASDQALGRGWGEVISEAAHTYVPLGQEVSSMAQWGDERPGLGDLVQEVHDWIRGI